MLKDLAVVRRGAFPQSTRALNRAFNVLFASAGLVLLLPLFGLIAIAIKLDDGGAVLYRQQRAGRHFKSFHLYKFRSMAAGADQKGLLTAPGDSRLTRVGRIIRQYKLDELPQLFNVLIGDMQLVGARPEVDRYVQLFHAEYALLLQDRPGITDPASLAYRHEEKMFSASQMEGQYISEILPAKLSLSLTYQHQRSLASDVRILLQTIFSIIG